LQQPGDPAELSLRRARATDGYDQGMSHKILFGFHAVTVRLKTAPKSIIEVHVDTTRRDQRMRQFVEKLGAAGTRVVDSDDDRLQRMCGTNRHQGVVARVEPVPMSRSVDDTLDAVDAAQGVPLLLVLDGITDPHNLGACLRVADGAGAHAVIAPRDHAVGVNATVAKVASGAAETVPYFMVTNLARSLNELKDRNIRVIGTADTATRSLYDVDLSSPVAIVLGAEGTGMRQLTSRTCDELVHLPMRGAVESLNVSVASGVCLYEAVRQRIANARVHATDPSGDGDAGH
jgi:23S rRNA (guanosine2251-2'-O)-methyltransferase